MLPRLLRYDREHIFTLVDEFTKVCAESMKFLQDNINGFLAYFGRRVGGVGCDSSCVASVDMFASPDWGWSLMFKLLIGLSRLRKLLEARDCSSTSA